MGNLSAEYHAHINSPTWKRIRALALERAGHRCQLCNTSKRLDVHHRTYERFGRENVDDLTVLCRPCHEWFHKKPKPGATPAKKRKKKPPKAKTVVVNGRPVDKKAAALERKLQERDPTRRRATEAQQARYEKRREERAAKRQELEEARKRLAAEQKAA